MKYYAVIDTNVLVSAMLKWNSVPGHIIELVFDGLIVPVFSREIIEEYKEVLSRSKFHLSNDIVEDIIGSLTDSGIFVDGETQNMEFIDEKDRMFFEVVMEERKEEDAYLVTGNIRHFPVEPFIVTPRQMLDIIVKSIDE
ncbi:MAG: putative toxin-antitoxin system toxin component, PIN family [Alphaproteobacteria bacterium]|nr:putative toxin-antitoxin system toxin component, PIN family [Alphaproteobacteria bacterium]MBQ5560222.1 putative toxin-antitoxin system toxin component, PIN family [Lachnospiraceae bacterium]